MGKDKSRYFKHRSEQRQKPYGKDKRGKFNGPRQQHNKKPPTQREFVPRVSLAEKDVGITEFVNEAPAALTGIIKSRFSDFHVNEIDLNGQVLHLTDLKVPQPVESTLSDEELQAAHKELESVISSEQWNEIRALLSKEKGAADAVVKLDVTELDKETRTKIHKILKSTFAGKLVSTTVSADYAADKKFIQIKRPIAGRDRNRNQWTFHGEYVHFLVHKENMDTSEAVVAIAERLNLRPSNINYCGTKDKRAKTTQKFCIKKRLPSNILSATKSLPAIHVGNFTFSHDVVKLGDLKGNRFRIALRHVSGEQAKIELALESLRTRGFINYYGLQRFGNCAAIPTYDVGVALLKSDYKLACELILKPRDNDIPYMQKIRETWWRERNSAAAADMFRNNKTIEKRLLDGLARYGEHDYATALRMIPRNMLLFYPHSFQSLIFNRVLSRRISQLGLRLVVGDLVYRDKNELDALDEVMDCADDEAMADDESQSDEKAGVKKEEESVEVKKEEESLFKRKVKALTSEDIASGAYTLFDVVLPLPGFDIKYPENEVAQWYEELLQEYGLTSETLRHSVQTYALAGAYRRMLLQPQAMSWEFRNYETPECTLIASDWELLRGKTLPENNSEGKYKALILDFCLPTAAYATMLLRELLKADTSAKNQVSLEQQARNAAPSLQADPTTNNNTTTSTDSPTACSKHKLDDDGDDAAAVDAKEYPGDDAEPAIKMPKISSPAPATAEAAAN